MPDIRDLVKGDIFKGFAKTLAFTGKVFSSEEERGVLFKNYTEELLQNNPYVPPKDSCPINDLPNELLAYIFLVGAGDEELDEDDGFSYTGGEDQGQAAEGSHSHNDGDNDVQMSTVESDDGNEEWEDDDQSLSSESGSDSEEDSDEAPFQVLVSHVCRRWREISVNTPGLWTDLDFLEGRPFHQSLTYIERSKTQPLNVDLDLTTPATHSDEDEDDDDIEEQFFSDDDIVTIMSILAPQLFRVRTFEVMANKYQQVHTVMSYLSDCPSAPELQTLQLYHYEDCEEYEIFSPAEYTQSFRLFNNNVPNLSAVAFWGVHIQWEDSLSLLSGLRDFELSYHAKNVRPSWSAFVSILDASPNLETLTLCLSGPRGEPSSWPGDIIPIPSIKSLVLTYHEAEYIEPLMKLLSFPSLTSLTLDYADSDYSDFARQLAGPAPGNKEGRSLLSQLEHLKISGLPTDTRTVDVVYTQLQNCKTLNLNMHCLGVDWLEKLESPSADNSTKHYLPKLHTISSVGVSGERMKQFVSTRQAAGIPLKKVFMGDDDDMEKQDELWLREKVDLEYFEPSEFEEEEEMIDVIDLDDDF